MNKKEIAQRFTRQIVGQSPSTGTHEQLLNAIRVKAKMLNGNPEKLSIANLGTTSPFQKDQRVSICYRYWRIIPVRTLFMLITNPIKMLKVY